MQHLEPSPANITPSLNESASTVLDISLASTSIVVVDDDQFMRSFIGTLLANAGYTNISFAENGERGLELIRSTHPSCVLLDIDMPVMSGLEVLEHIRADPLIYDLPVLVISARTEHQERNEILHAGATNLISKPIDHILMIERVADTIKHKLLVDQLKEFHRRLEIELSMAADMQNSLMPTRDEMAIIESKHSVKMVSHVRPSSELGGDCWFLQPIDNDRFGVMIVDFAGHGVASALNTFRLHMVIDRIGVCKGSPAEYLEQINQELVSVMATGQYCTALYALVDTTNNKLTYSGAAAQSLIYGNTGTHQPILGDGSGLPIAVRKNTKYDDKTVEFTEGSFLFLFSDALTETDCGEAGDLGTEGVLSLVEKYLDPDPGTSLGDILAHFYEQTTLPLPDDLTTIWVSR